MKNSVLAWHFLDNNIMRDGRQAPPDGEVLTHSGELELCASGLHASIEILHALDYAPGLTLCRVECGGELVHGTDKLVCRERVILWRIDEVVMRRVVIWWAAWCAERAQHHKGAEARAAAWAARSARAAAAAEAATWAASAAARAAAWAEAATWAAEREVQSDELLRLIEIARQAQ